MLFLPRKDFVNLIGNYIVNIINLFKKVVWLLWKGKKINNISNLNEHFKWCKFREMFVCGNPL